jgi:hypothetical protein
MFHNEAHWLRLHLPHLISEHYDLVMLDGGSHDDSAAIARMYRAKVTNYDFEFDWSKQANTLLKFAKVNGYKNMVRLDPDELMFVDDIKELFDELKNTELIYLPRFNFESDRHHYCAELYPDFQARAYQLEAVHYQGIVHEGVSGFKNSKFSMHTHIYHYEGLNSMRYRTLKAVNVQRYAQMLSRLEELPREYASVEMKPRRNVEFNFPQPAAFINIKAPFGD